jgi:hypothetical protein
MNRPSAHQRHHRQRGQAVPVIALASVLLVGATALAVDLSLNTHTRRSLQNATDAAALAGAQDLPTTVSQNDRQKAAFDAVVTLYRELNQPTPDGPTTGSVIANGPGCNNGGNRCHVGLTVGTYSVSVDTPPATAHNPNYDIDGYVEVNLAHTDRNNFGQVVGYATSTESGHSVAYHFAGGQGWGLALYADTYVATGNDGELVDGNIYAQRNVNPQSGGQAGFCAGNGGRIVLGAPQTSGSGGQLDVVPHSADHVNTILSCGTATIANTTASGTVNQTVSLSQMTVCNNNPLPGINVTATYDATVGTCVANPPVQPPTTNFQEPTHYDSPIYNCVTNPTGTPGPSGPTGNGYYSCNQNNTPALTITGTSMPPGVYTIDHNPQCTSACYDLDFYGANVQAIGVTIILINGATMGVEHNANVTIDPTREPNGSPCPQFVQSDCRFSIYSGVGSNSTLQISGQHTSLLLYGTLYMVAGTVATDTNATFEIVQGQAIVGTWNVQSGNQGNPVINFDAGLIAPQSEVLRLVE